MADRADGLKGREADEEAEKERKPDPAKQGGWWCYGHCQRFVELNLDREVNVCGRCGRPCVAFRPPAVQGRLEIGGRRLSPQEAHEWFEKMRKAI